MHAWHGELAYDPAKVQAPVAIIRGAWDGLIPDEDARWLFDAFSKAPIKRDIKISRATHLMHLEAMRFALYRESITFLQGNDKAPAPVSSEKHRLAGSMVAMSDEHAKIPGYDFGKDNVAKSPISMSEWEDLKSQLSSAKKTSCICVSPKRCSPIRFLTY